MFVTAQALRLEVLNDPDVRADDDIATDLGAHHDACFEWALACCRYNNAEAEDVLQVAYLKILDGRARFHGRSSLRTWLFGVIRHTAHEHHRRARIRDALSGRVLVDLVVRAVRTSAPAMIEQHRDHTALRRALAALPARQREVLELVAYHDLTIEQAGAVLGILGRHRAHPLRARQASAAFAARPGRLR